MSPEPRIPISVAAKSDTDKRSGGVPADSSDHSEASVGKSITPPPTDIMTTEKKRGGGFLSLFRRRKNSKDIKPVVVVVNFLHLLAQTPEYMILS